MISVLMHLAVPGTGTAGGITGTLEGLAAAVVVIGALIGLARAIFRLAVAMRDNTAAVHSLTGRMDELAISVDGRFDKLAERVAELEWREHSRHPAEDQPGSVERKHHRLVSVPWC
jgi:hypothetical protein